MTNSKLGLPVFQDHVKWPSNLSSWDFVSDLGEGEGGGGFGFLPGMFVLYKIF